MTPRKANQPQLTREQIVATALELIDEHGLESHSMRQLGAALGVDPSSIYYYVPSKTELHTLLVDEVMRGIDLSGDDPATPVEERLVAAANEYRRALLVHPRLMPLVAGRSMRTVAQLRSVEAMLAILDDAGLTPPEQVVALDVFAMQVVGMAHAYASNLVHSEYHERAADFDELPADEFPRMNRLLTEGAYFGFDLEFDRGVRSMAKGVLAMHESGTLVTAEDLARAHSVREGDDS